MTHPSNPDQLMARALGICWHPPTSDRWPCTARPEPGAVPGDGWAAPETPADHPLRLMEPVTHYRVNQRNVAYCDADGEDWPCEYVRGLW